MNRKLLLYRLCMVCASLASGSALFLSSGRVTREDVLAILLLSILAVIAELLAVVLPNSARGSIAFIPYLAAALVVPSWPTVLAVAAVKALVEAVRRSEPVRALLNVALHVLTVSSAIWVYTFLGGRSLLSTGHGSLLSATVAVGFPALMSVAVSFLVNT